MFGSIPGGAQGQAGWGPRQPELGGGWPCPKQGLGLGGLWGPFQPKLFCDVMVKETTKCRHHTSELVGMQLVH